MSEDALRGWYWTGVAVFALVIIGRLVHGSGLVARPSCGQDKESPGRVPGLQAGFGDSS